MAQWLNARQFRKILKEILKMNIIAMCRDLIKINSLPVH